jgi:hypothetical protein
MKKNEETPFEKFRQFTQKIVSVPKSEIDKREAQYQKERLKIKKSGSKKEPD